MAEFVVGNFKYGLDTRRDALTSQPGTLVTCENCFINAGGEVEKRKQFDLYGNVAILDSNGSQGTFGLEAVGDGLVTFGSALSFGSSVTQSQPTLASFTSPLAYRQLQHPSIANDTAVSYDATKHRMTAVPFSLNFNGDIMVAATFTDSNTFLYIVRFNDNNIGTVPFDYGLIQQSANGRVLAGRATAADLADDLKRQLDAIGWVSYANVDQYGASYNGSVLIRSPQNDYFTVVSEDPVYASQVIGFRQIAQDGNTARSLTNLARSGATATATAVRHGFIIGDRVKVSGATQVEYNGLFTITAATQDTFAYTVSGTPATPATGTPIAVLDGAGERAMASFQIITNTGTFLVSSEIYSGAGGRTDLHAAAIAAGASATATALAIAEAINDMTSFTGHSAVSNGAEVFVYAAQGFQPSFNLRVTYTTGVILATAGSPTSPIAVITPSPLVVEKTVAYKRTIPPVVRAEAVCSIASGTGPFTYAWTKLTGDITLLSGSASSARAEFYTTFSTQDFFPIAGTKSGNFKCVVTDSTSPTPQTFTVYLTVTLILKVTNDG